MDVNGTANQLESVLEEQQTIDEDLELARVFQHGITMKEVAQLKSPTIKTSEEAILALKIGNARFFSGSRTPLTFSAIERRAQILTQNPFAVILGCSDSRVPTEIIYDQRARDLNLKSLIILWGMD